MQENVVVVNQAFLIAIMFLLGALCIGMGYLLFRPWFKRNVMTASQRRRAHKRYVRDTIVELRFKIINLTLACERGDLSLTAFNRRALNAAVLIRRYEIKLAHLNRLVG